MKNILIIRRILRENIPHAYELGETDKEFNKEASNLTIWLTGLAVGQLTFILSNSEIFLLKEVFLFKIGMLILMARVLSGLFYHLIKVIRFYGEKNFLVSHAKHIYIRKNLFKVKDTYPPIECEKLYSELQKYKSKRTFYLSLAISSFPIMDIAWKFNVSTFFIGSFIMAILFAFTII